ncbi:MAG: hypothetical protein Q9170_004564 [Blastenia crenularia]
MAIPKGTARPKIFIARGVHVGLAQLICYILAHADTKAVVTTFQLAARDTALRPLQSLPEEISTMIANKIRGLSFTSLMDQYRKASKRRSRQGNTASGISASQIGALRSWPKGSVDVDRIKRPHPEDQINSNGMEEYCEMPTDLKGDSTFAKAVQIFTGDFWIKPCLLVNKCWDGGCLESIDATARAERALKLYVYDEEEDEVVFEDAESDGSIGRSDYLGGPTSPTEQTETSGKTIPETLDEN